MDLLDELDQLLAQERDGGATPPTSYVHQLSGYTSQEPLLTPHGKPTHPMCLPLPLVPPPTVANVSAAHLLAQASMDEASAFLWQGDPSRTLVEVPVSINRVDIKAVKSSMVMNAMSLSYEFASIAVDGQSMAETSNLMLRKPTQLQDYARGKIGNVPFTPGGDSLVTSDTIDPSMASRLAKVYTTDPAAALAVASDWETHLDAFFLPAPGLSEGFTHDDIARLSGASSAPAVMEPSVACDTVGVNPSTLLRPYYDVVADAHSLHALTRAIADDKALRAMDVGNPALSVQSLLSAAGDDLAWGDDDEEPPATAATSHSDQLTKSNADMPSNVEPFEEEEWLEVSSFAETATTATTASFEWASVAEVDVSDFDSKDLAMKFPFELDSFQKQAVVHLENHDCVFIAAHTSAGKTVVAEYAIAMSQKHMTRTIYTSPIKALSNQKYRDFRTKFGVDNVGLITGDVSINPEASCLVMTTEILRSMLYRGADVIRDIEWVIFDEIHYLNDSERGVVWEEVIIMLPEHVSMVFLSATTPNTFEFSDWIGRTKQKKIHVISTYKRPVPLGHHLYAGGEIIPIVDASTNQFLPASHTYATQKVKPKEKPKGTKGAPSSSSFRSNMGRGGGDKADWTKFIRLLQDKTLLPVVVFAFSKRMCEESANRLAGMDLSSSSERSEIHVFCAASISRLQGTDQQLPQVLQVRDMLLRGIGVHHGGLLPILKEMVEILFGRGLVKVLFSTETFAMGVNMPARTVVFNGIRKHDGKSFRDLLPGEYTQMAGRAGRRGLDAIGTVIIACWGEVSDTTSLRTMLLGLPTKLESQFRLTYNMILNLLRVEDMTVEDMIKRSFSEFRTQKALASKNIPHAIQKAKKILVRLEEDLEHTHGGQLDLAHVQLFYELTTRTKLLEKHLVGLILSSKFAAAALCIGRVLVVSTADLADAVAIVLQVNKGTVKSFVALALCPASYSPPPAAAADTAPSHLRSGMLIPLGRREPKSAGLKVGDTGSLLGKHYVVLELPESCVDLLTQDKGSTAVRNLLEASDVSVLSRAMELLVDMEPKIKYILDPRADLKMNDIDVVGVYSNIQHMYGLMQQNVCFNSPFVLPVLGQFAKIAKLREYVAGMTAALSNHSLSLFPDFQQRLKVLTRLGYIAQDNTVQVKGRVACEVNTCEELILTEIIFENVLASLEPEEIVSVLSALIFQEKTQNATTLTPRLMEAQTTVQAIALSLGLIQLEAHLEIDPNEYVKSTLNFGLMEVVYEWSRGMPFKAICELTDVPEGSIVRCITRLDEVCREVRNAARVIGDPRLYRKMEIASESIKRDVVFATSLYLS
ncbi:hypothetical protein H257_14698 [Aphanomyces astaci]|uniref:Helicase SKI2W n=1 Tax=Aphanomyces astaci TaxID=112090 RepID=W4FS79_APHAT|nr:hypothetical protein H257_14698 [Aphanomyces astaci]ETV69679.1 hypothetical protein H257_14698 [Aphanomyces astaci]|eukprot:XP_009840895.1 hypothetical protein H257_14698 [Aphanomyces astaci]